MHKSKNMPTISPSFCKPPTYLISMLHFRMCSVLKFNAAFQEHCCFDYLRFQYQYLCRTFATAAAEVVDVHRTRVNSRSSQVHCSVLYCVVGCGSRLSRLKMLMLLTILRARTGRHGRMQRHPRGVVPVL